MTTHRLGRFGVWGAYGGFDDETARAIEQLGFATIWIGGSPNADLAVVERQLAATDTITVATSIVNIWTASARHVAESFHRLETRFPGRFILGIGVGHREANADYRKPYDAVVEYLDELATAGVPRERIMLAALGPRMLRLAAERTAGPLPYLVPPQHTQFARDTIGSDSVLAVEQKVVLSQDLEQARVIGRAGISFYLGLRNYTDNLRRFGFTDEDLTEPGSDRLVDTLALPGNAEQLAAGLTGHLEAGADHVAAQILTEGETRAGDIVPTLRALAPLLVP